MSKKKTSKKKEFKIGDKVKVVRPETETGAPVKVGETGVIVRKTDDGDYLVAMDLDTRDWYFFPDQIELIRAAVGPKRWHLIYLSEHSGQYFKKSFYTREGAEWFAGKLVLSGDGNGNQFSIEGLIEGTIHFDLISVEGRSLAK